jgi:hypothetical protein
MISASRGVSLIVLVSGHHWPDLIADDFQEFAVKLSIRERFAHCIL